MENTSPEATEDQPFTEAEQLGLVLVGTLNRLERERDSARTWAMALEADLTEALETLDQLLKEWPTTSWAHDELPKANAADVLARLRDPERGQEAATMATPKTEE